MSMVRCQRVGCGVMTEDRNVEVTTNGFISDADDKGELHTVFRAKVNVVLCKRCAEHLMARDYPGGGTQCSR